MRMKFSGKTVVKKKADLIETDGPANIIMQLDMLTELNTEFAPSFEFMKQEALKTVEYMKKLQNSKKVKWHDIK